MRLCAFFAPDDIPLNMIIKGVNKLHKSLAAIVTDTLLLDEALMVLRKYSLVELEDEKLSIHRMVQAVIRHEINKSDFKKWTGIAVQVVNASFPFDSDDVRTWPVCALYYHTHQSHYHTPKQYSLPQIKPRDCLIKWVST